MHATRYRAILIIILFTGMQWTACCRGTEPSDPSSLSVPPAGAAASVPDATLATKIDWIRDYSEARIKGMETGKPVFLFVTTDHCVYCNRMNDGPFRDQRILEELHGTFVPAKLKLSAESDLARQLRITIYPTTVIIAADGSILEYIRGYISADDLDCRLAKATAEPLERIAALPDTQP